MSGIVALVMLSSELVEESKHGKRPPSTFPPNHLTTPVMFLLISTERNTHFSVGVGDQSLTRIKTVNKAFRQSELLLKEIEHLQPSDVAGIIVVQGPGDFSALRIGIATANALAFAWSVPVVGIKLSKTEQALDEREKMAALLRRGSKSLQQAKPGAFVLPLYDRPPNITVKKK